MIFEVLQFWVGRTTVRTWHENRGRFVGDSFGAVRYFLLAGNCEFVADMYFPEDE
jgi:hypothetical protein